MCRFRTPSPAQVRTRLPQYQQGFAGTAPAHPWAGLRANRYAQFGGRLSKSPAALRQRGFSMVELVAAFMIFALAFGLLLEILTGAVRSAKLAAEQTQAALWAQSKLDTLGIGERLEEGNDSGDFDDHYRWELGVSRYELLDSPALSGEVARTELYRVELVVHWGERKRERSTRFVTLRALNPDTTGGL